MDWRHEAVCRDEDPDQLGLSDLGKCRTRIAYWEEQLGVFVAANSFVAPIHD